MVILVEIANGERGSDGDLPWFGLCVVKETRGGLSSQLCVLDVRLLLVYPATGKREGGGYENSLTHVIVVFLMLSMSIEYQERSRSSVKSRWLMMMMIVYIQVAKRGRGEGRGYGGKRAYDSLVRVPSWTPL